MRRSGLNASIASTPSTTSAAAAHSLSRSPRSRVNSSAGCAAPEGALGGRRQPLAQRGTARISVLLDQRRQRAHREHECVERRVAVAVVRLSSENVFIVVEGARQAVREQVAQAVEVTRGEQRPGENIDDDPRLVVIPATRKRGMPSSPPKL
eukprot:3042891-Prymnesium_polylepis.1